MWLKRTNIQLMCSLIEQKRTDKRTNMQNICFEKPKRPLGEQIFGTKNKNMSVYVAKKNKYSDYLFGSQTTGEQII